MSASLRSASVNEPSMMYSTISLFLFVATVLPFVVFVGVVKTIACEILFVKSKGQIFPTGHLYIGVRE